jgi:hypothetical protein
MESQARPLNSRNILPVRSELLIYFGLTFAFTWAFHLAIIIFKLPFTSDSGSAGQLLYAIGIAGPLIAALIASGVSSGLAGVLCLIKAAFRWRFGWTWYALALFIVGAIYLLSLGLYHFLGGALPNPLFRLTFSGVLFAVLGQIYVVIGEEYGWRGFALPRLQGIFGSLGASLILGAVWACWHLPMFFVSGSNQYGASFLRYSLDIVSWTIVLTLIYYRTGGSVLACMIFHASSNLWFFILNVPKKASLFALGLTVLAGLYGLTRLPRPLFKNISSRP